MIPTAADPAPPPPLPPQPPRSSFSCDKHPDEQFNGFCPSCLCERLVLLDQLSSNNNNQSSSSRRHSTSSASAVASIKSLFSSSSSSKPFASAITAVPAANANPPPPKPLKPASFFPELRRTKSFCASKHEAFGLNFSGAFEPQRKSCDVRLRNSLWSLFTLDDESKITSSKACSSVAIQHPHSIDINDSCVSRPVLESKEEDEIEESEIRSESDEIVPVVQQANVGEKEDISLEIVHEDEEVDLSTIKPMKDHIDNDSHAKRPSGGVGGVNFKEIAGSFLSATSVFSKKWQKWRQKQKQRKRNNGLNPSTLSMEKPISRNYRETQSEVADYGFGRRSCDTDPRFSLDVGRISFDDPRYSLDEPRASWDGYYINSRNFPRIPPMLSVVEDSPIVPTVARTDAYIPVEEPPPPMDDFIPGGSAQTNEYYSDSSSRRRKSLDRSNSIRKTAAAVVAEMDEMKAISNIKPIPAASTKVSVGERDTNSNCISNDYNDYPENFNLGGFRNHGSVVNNRETNGHKISRRWSWKLWGFIQRRSGRNKDEDEDEDDMMNTANRGVERSFSESWQDLRRRGGEGNGGILLRSNSSVSWRQSNNVGGVLSSGNVRKLGIDINGGGYNNRKKGGDDECVLERNRSGRRYSHNNNTENGLLQFYLTPLKNSRRSRNRSRSQRAVSATKRQV